MALAPVLKNLALTGILFYSVRSLLAGPPATKEAHTRVLAGTPEAILPKAMEWLMDNQYVIRSVNQAAGFLSFYKVARWKGSYANSHIVKLEGCIQLQSTSPKVSVARMLVNQEWYEVPPMGSVSEMGVETDTDEAYYKVIFNGVEQQLGRVTP